MIRVEVSRSNTKQILISSCRLTKLKFAPQKGFARKAYCAAQRAFRVRLTRAKGLFWRTEPPAGSARQPVRSPSSAFLTCFRGGAADIGLRLGICRGIFGRSVLRGGYGRSGDRQALSHSCEIPHGVEVDVDQL